MTVFYTKDRDAMAKFEEYKPAPTNDKFQADEGKEVPRDASQQPPKLFTEAFRTQREKPAEPEKIEPVLDEHSRQLATHMFMMMSSHAATMHTINHLSTLKNAALRDGAFKNTQELLNLISQLGQAGLAALMNSQAGNSQYFAHQQSLQMNANAASMEMTHSQTNTMLTTFLLQNSSGIVMMSKIQEWLEEHFPELFGLIKEQAEDREDYTDVMEQTRNEALKIARMQNEEKARKKKKAESGLFLSFFDVLNVMHELSFGRSHYSVFLRTAPTQTLDAQQRSLAPTPKPGRGGSKKGNQNAEGV